MGVFKSTFSGVFFPPRIGQSFEYALPEIVFPVALCF